MLTDVNELVRDASAQVKLQTRPYVEVNTMDFI